MVVFVFQLIFVVIATAGSTYLPNTRTYWIVFDMAFAIAGAAMVRQIPSSNKWGRFFGYCLTMGYTPNFPILLSMLSANIGGFTKKMTVNAMVCTILDCKGVQNNIMRYYFRFLLLIARAISLDHSSSLRMKRRHIHLASWLF